VSERFANHIPEYANSGIVALVTLPPFGFKKVTSVDEVQTPVTAEEVIKNNFKFFSKMNLKIY